MKVDFPRKYKAWFAAWGIIGVLDACALASTVWLRYDPLNALVTAVAPLVSSLLAKILSIL